jgi:integrase
MGANRGKSASSAGVANATKCNSPIAPASGLPHGARGREADGRAYRHGLRASELVALRWDDINLRAGKLHVRRVKGGETSVHPLGARELRALRRLQRESPRASTHCTSSYPNAPPR